MIAAMYLTLTGLSTARRRLFLINCRHRSTLPVTRCSLIDSANGRREELKEKPKSEKGRTSFYSLELAIAD